MRQLGGSFGISILNTYVTRSVATHRVDLISNIRYDNSLAMERLQDYTSLFVSKGATLYDAQQKALALMEKSVVKQSMFVSYLDGYLFIGSLFLLAMPLLLFFLRKGKGKKVVAVQVDH